jgi:hypothetical protein
MTRLPSFPRLTGRGFSSRPAWGLPILNTGSPQAVGLRAWWPVQPFTGIASTTLVKLADCGPSGGRYPAPLPSLATNFSTCFMHPTAGPVARGNTASTVGAAVTNGADFVNIPGSYNFAIFCRASHTLFEASALAAISFNGTDDLILYPYSTDANGPRVFWRDLGGTIINAANPIADGHLHDFCFVSYAANDHRLFVDGNQFATSTATGTAGPFSGMSLMGYSESGAQGYRGSICDFRLYDRAPSPALIKSMSDPASQWDLYLGGASSLVGLWSAPPATTGRSFATFFN